MEFCGAVGYMAQIAPVAVGGSDAVEVSQIDFVDKTKADGADKDRVLAVYRRHKTEEDGFVFAVQPLQLGADVFACHLAQTTFGIVEIVGFPFSNAAFDPDGDGRIERFKAAKVKFAVIGGGEAGDLDGLGWLVVGGGCTVVGTAVCVGLFTVEVGLLGHRIFLLWVGIGAQIGGGADIF